MPVSARRAGSCLPSGGALRLTHSGLQVLVGRIGLCKGVRIDDGIEEETWPGRTARGGPATSIQGAGCYAPARMMTAYWAMVLASATELPQVTLAVPEPLAVVAPVAMTFLPASRA